MLSTLAEVHDDELSSSLLDCSLTRTQELSSKVDFPCRGLKAHYPGIGTALTYNEEDGPYMDRNSGKNTPDGYDTSDHDDTSNRDNTSDGNSASDYDEVDIAVTDTSVDNAELGSTTPLLMITRCSIMQLTMACG